MLSDLTSAVPFAGLLSMLTEVTPLSSPRSFVSTLMFFAVFSSVSAESSTGRGVVSSLLTRLTGGILVRVLYPVPSVVLVVFIERLTL